MWRKLWQKAQSVKMKSAAALTALKQDERGLSGVVVAILLILIAVLAIIMIWGFLSGWLADMWDRITENTVA